MFAMISISLFALFLTFSLAFPFLKKTWIFYFINYVKSFITAGREVVVFPLDGGRSNHLVWMQLWGVFASGALVVLATGFGYSDFRSPASVANTVLYIISAAAVSSMIVAAIVAFKGLFPATRMINFSRQSGLQGMWQMTSGGKASRFQRMLSDRSMDTSFIGMIGVTGNTLLGNGPGEKGGFLYDAFTVADSVPGSVLLLHPDSSTIDPGRRKITVVQEVLGDMQISEEAFRRQLRTTVEAIDDLNAKRSKTASIKIRLYCEKPSVIGAFFDNSAVIAPWQPKEKDNIFISVSAGRTTASLFDLYRSQFLRLWASACTITNQTGMVLRQGSKAVRQKKVTA